ncbi:DPH4 homolog [Venturia canescens]|uniref:DPH4 homolog n=1 Tax=Venturia canescens TaxID=32260 RepID=UPI001C9BF174|nr:DPH4 homolog [Venturia canescens]
MPIILDKTDSSNDQNTDKFREIEEAWQILRDPEARKKYDSECRQAQLESQSILVFATITENEMEITVDDDTLSYQCRCGSYYLVNREDLLKKNCSLHIPCQECTFVLIVQT